MVRKAKVTLPDGVVEVELHVGKDGVSTLWLVLKFRDNDSHINLKLGVPNEDLRAAATMIMDKLEALQL